MTDPRTFTVCQGCGAWREHKSDLMSFLNDYEMRFFVEEHLGKCPITGNSEPVISVSEDDPGFAPLLREKQWRPENCPSYRPPQTPKFERLTSNIASAIPGVWRSNSFGGHSDETFILFTDGNGALDFYNVTYCGRRTFRWRLDDSEHLTLEGETHYFKTSKPRFEMGLFTNECGETFDMLRVFGSEDESLRMEFIRADQPLSEYVPPTGGFW
jgi:hypothetical protein